MNSPASKPRVVVVTTADTLVLNRLRQLARDHHLVIVSAHSPTGASVAEVEAHAPPDGPLEIAVVDLEQPGAVAMIAALRERWPEVLLAGHLASPQSALWLSAEQAGCDLVASRGAFALQLGRLLATWEGPRRRRFPLVASADIAGRLGLVQRFPESPLGPVALYHLGGRLYVAGDACPHAGAQLSTGELSGPVVTCPRHGSQFDVRSGERLRGPADVEIRTYPVVEEGGQVYVLVEP